MLRISTRSRLCAQSDPVFSHQIHALMRMSMDVTPVMGKTWFIWWTPMTPTARTIRSGRSGTTSTLRTMLVTVRILIIKNIISIMVKLPTMNLTTATRDQYLILIIMGQLRIRVQFQRMPELCRYWTWRWRRGPIPLWYLFFGPVWQGLSWWFHQWVLYQLWQRWGLWFLKPWILWKNHRHGACLPLLFLHWHYGNLLQVICRQC